MSASDTARRRLTGERVVTDAGGFNPTWQRHVAAYAACATLLPDGRVLDLGCGIGHCYELFAPRETVGVDIDAAALDGQRRETHVADMRALPFDGSSFDAIVSVHSIEHVPDPERAFSEVVRVLREGGVAAFVTPNRLTFARPDEIIDPYHYLEYSPGELEGLCSQYFDAIELRGLFGSERYGELVAEEKERLDQLLARDPLRLRRLAPRRLRQHAYDRLLARARRDHDPRSAAISPADFRVGDRDLDQALDLIAVCRRVYPPGA